VLNLKDDLKEILFSEEMLRRRVSDMGAEIAADYAGKTPLLIGVLKGCFVFLADLVRCIDLKCDIRFLAASSYGLSSISSGTVTIGTELDFMMTGQDILLIEDILDSGVTLTALCEFIEAQEPSSLKICALLDKPARRKMPVSADYLGFECPDEFIVGYGLDYAERYRNLPYIASLRPEVYS